MSEQTEAEAPWVPVIERDVDPDDDKRTHLYTFAPDRIAWLNDEQADAVQAFIDAASRPEPLGLRVWIDEDDALRCDLSSIGMLAGVVITVLTAGDADTLRAAFPELHPGVSRNADGSLSAPGAALRTLPEGWEWSELGVGWWAPSLFLGADTALYYVRPPQKPETRWVPWWEAPGRCLASGQAVSNLRVEPNESAPGGVYVEMFLNDDVWANPIRDDEGRVEVLLAEVPR